MLIIKLQSEYNDLDKYEHKYEDRGHIFYYKKGTNIYHNPYGPAYISHNGYKEYIVNNNLHKLDGPARIWPNGYVEYYIYGKELTKEEFEIHPDRLKFLGKEYLICLK